MYTIERHDSAASAISNTSKSVKATHCIIQHSNVEKNKEIVRLNQILNPSNRRLKVGDDGTLKGEGRHHVRVKILCLSDLETCQHQMDIIEETRINNGMLININKILIIILYVRSGMELTNISSGNNFIDDIDFDPCEQLKKKQVTTGCMKSTTSKFSESQAKNTKVLSVVNSSRKFTSNARQQNNKENITSKEKQIRISTKDNVFHHLKKPTNLAASQTHNHQPTTASQTRNHQQTTASKIFVTPKVSDRALAPQWSNPSCSDLSSTRNSDDQSKNIENLNSSPKQLTTQQRKDDNESFNSSVDQLDDSVLDDDDDDIDEETSATGVSDNKRVYDKQDNHTLLIEHNRLRNRFDRLNAKYKALQKENEILKNHTIPIPPPEIQQWFSQTAQRFEKKPLSGTVLENFSKQLNLPVKVLISLTQSTGSLTARAIVRYLFPSKSRTLEDIPGSVRDSILGSYPNFSFYCNMNTSIHFLGYVKYCHPTELFVRGKINEAISGPFRTAKFKALHSAAAEDENELMEEIHHDIETISLHEVQDQADTENAADWIDDNGSETLIDTQITYDSQPSIKRNLTKKEIATTLIILKVRHKLTTRAVSDICRLLRLFHVPNAPKSFAAAKRLMEREASDNMKPDILHICHQCNNVYKDVCDDATCQQNNRELQSSIFLKFPIKDQIQSILATERNFVLHSQSPVWPNDRIAEIQHADWYRSIAENEDKSNFITLMLNVDGIAMSGSSDNSLWIFTVTCH
ncbi:unnamed protein product [Rotaria socialis]|uniref:Uncharacterized protein n=4 Tax=Rotaria socialis TaxID=392032 RepID=A0A817T7U4_9BILA|nr:unnamed protein product [Rotaria socialis]